MKCLVSIELQWCVRLRLQDVFPDALDPSLRLIFVVLHVIIIVLAVGGNLLVFLVVAVNRKLRTVGQKFYFKLHFYTQHVLMNIETCYEYSLPFFLQQTNRFMWLSDDVMM